MIRDPPKTKAGNTLQAFATGTAWKSADMLLLDHGCENVLVADIHMSRLLDPSTTQERVRKEQATEKRYDALYNSIEKELNKMGCSKEQGNLGTCHVGVWCDQASQDRENTPELVDDMFNSYAFD